MNRNELNDPLALFHKLLSHGTSTGAIDPCFTEHCRVWLEALGFEVRSVETDGVAHLAATIGPTNPKLRLAFVGHYDTVPEHPSQKRAAPDSTTGGTLFARGASDMKSGVAAMISAACSLASYGIHSTVFLAGDEETLSKGVPALLSELNSQFDYCIGGEPTSRLKLGDCIKIGRRGTLQGCIILHGQAGHAAYAHRTPNIIESLPDVLQELKLPWNDSFSGTESTLSVTDIRTDSTAPNVIPSNVWIYFDCRTAPHRQLEDIKTEIRHRIERTAPRFDLTWTTESIPYLCDSHADQQSPQAVLVRCSLTAINEILAVTPEQSCDGGTSDARFLAAQGVPTIEVGVPHGNMHGPEEFVDTENIPLLAKVYLRIGQLLLDV